MLPRRAALAAASALLILPAACSSVSQGYKQGSSTKKSTGGTVLTLQASADKGVTFDVNWFPGSGKAQVKNSLTGSWSTSVTTDKPAAVNMGVQAESGSGNVTCKILKGSKVMVEQTKPGSDGANCAYPAS
jgi:hypothetical protein